MSKDNEQLPNIGAADPAWWTPERRAAVAARRKAHPHGIYSKEWWTHERKAAASDRLAAARAILAARREAGG